MEIKIGKKYFVGFGNAEFGTFALVKIIKKSDDDMKINVDYYEVELIENYCSIWEKQIPSPGSVVTVLEYVFFNTFDEAKKSFIKDMRLNDDYGIIEYIFKERNV